MWKYGIAKVRGAQFSAVYLSEDQIEAAQQMLLSADDLCFGCGQAGHFANFCPLRSSRRFSSSSTKSTIIGNSDSDDNGFDDSDSDDSDFDDSDFDDNGFDDRDFDDSSDDSSDNTCYRCGRLDHWASQCCASTTIDGKPLLPKIRSPASVGSRSYSTSSHDTPTRRYSESYTCYRCGYPGHLVNKCSARRTATGRRLDQSKK